MRQWLIDTAERAGFTFLETFLALVLASGTDWLNLSAIRAAGIGALAAALAVVKAAIASRTPDTVSPASLAR
jgi:hypothetical protein